MLILIFVSLSTGWAQSWEKWEYDFSTRVEMIATENEFSFRRCKLDVCQAISEKLPRPTTKELRREVTARVAETKHFRSQWIADALDNFDRAPKKHWQTTFGVSLGPEKIDVTCNTEIAEFLKKPILEKSKVEKDYIFRYEGASNKFCRSSRPGDPVRTVDVRKIISQYKSAFKEVQEEFKGQDL